MVRNFCLLSGIEKLFEEIKDYELDEKNKNAILTDQGIDKIEKLALQKNILNLNNVEIMQKDAISVISNNNLYISRCYISSKDALESIKKNKNTIYIISSNGEKIEHDKNMFHVKQENFTINSTDIRHIDVITVRWR